MRIFSERNIAKISFVAAILIVGGLVFSTGALFISNKIDTLNTDLTELEKGFIEEQKELLKADVSQQLARIDSRRADLQHELEGRLASRVMEAQAMAGSIYHTMKGRRSESDIAEVIREAFRPIRFNEEHGYVFILALDGTAILYPADERIEGTNFFHNGVSGGPEIIGSIIDLARENEHGFYRYDWFKPGDDQAVRSEKISYVALFKSLGWVIGTGEYVDNLETLARKTITHELRSSFKSETEDYFFVYELHNLKGGKDFATMLINSNRQDLVGTKISDDYLDIKGKAFRKEFLKGIREDGEAYVVYWYKKPGNGGIGRKLAYFKLYPEWNWVVARGIYFDRLDTIIAEKKQELSEKVNRDIRLLLEFFLAAMFGALVLAYFLSKGLQGIFDKYKRTQTEHLEKLESLNKALEQQSRTDPLTGIYNRGYFNKQLSSEISRANRYLTPLSLIIFDIDRFKVVNDTLGHLAGDSVLQELSKLVGDNIRQTDTLVRWGGEEFAILAPGIDKDMIGRFAENLRVLVEMHTFSVERKITCSFGVSCYIPPEESNALLLRVDEALYQAKQNGRNRVVVQ